MAPVATLMYMDLVVITFVPLEAHQETERNLKRRTSVTSTNSNKFGIRSRVTKIQHRD